MSNAFVTIKTCYVYNQWYDISFTTLYFWRSLCEVQCIVAENTAGIKSVTRWFHFPQTVKLIVEEGPGRVLATSVYFPAQQSNTSVHTNDSGLGCPRAYFRNWSEMEWHIHCYDWTGKGWYYSRICYCFTPKLRYSHQLKVLQSSKY